MLDHVSVKVADYSRSQAFYDRALAPLDVSRVMGDGQFFGGYGSQDKPYFWIGKGEQGGGAHIAFAVADRDTVDAFYKAAIAAGGRDNGPPGVREHYHPSYYGAFVLDPDGHNIEAVCHKPA